MAVVLLKKFSFGEIRSSSKVIETMVGTVIRVVQQAALLPLLLPLLAYIGAKSYLHYCAVTVVEQAIAALPDSVQFEFDDIDSHFDGVVELYGATLLLNGMSLPARFDHIRLISGDWQLLPSAVQLFSLGQLPHNAKLTFQLPETELIRLASAKLLPITSARRLLGCYQNQRATMDQGQGAADQSRDAGAVFSGSLDYRFDPASEYLNGQLKLAASERFQIELKTDLDIGAEQLELVSLNTENVGLGGAELQFFNLGSQTQLLNQCGATGRSGLVQGSYVARQSKVVKHGLLQQGWVVPIELELAYQDYLFLPVQLKLQLSAPYAIRLAELTPSSAGWGKFSLQLGLNQSGNVLHPMFWQPTANQLAAAPVTAILERSVDSEQSSIRSRGDMIASIEAEAAPAPLSETQIKRQLDDTVAYQPSYKPITPRQLAGLLGAPLKLTTHNGRRMEGVLDALESDQLQLRREVSHGFAVVPVRLDLISGMQAYF